MSDRAPVDLAAVSATLGGAGGIAAGFLMGGTDRLAVVSSTAGVGAALGGVAGMGLWVVCRTLDVAAGDNPADAIASGADRDRADPATGSPAVFSDRVPAVPRVFIGRDDLVARLAAGMVATNQPMRVCAIQGLAGVGKTSVAAAVAEAVRGEVDIVWWLRCEQPTDLVADLAALARHVGLPSSDDITATARSVRARLEETQKSWALVFDHVTTLASFSEWLPKRGSGSVLLTSRSVDVHRVADVVTIDTFQADVAARFLRTRVASANPRAVRGDLSGVIERLGGLPLALEQAAAWVSRAPTRTFEHFADAFDRAWDSVNDHTRPVGYDHTVSTTWQVSVASATEEAAHAGRLLAGLSFLASSALPCAWLEGQAGHPWLPGADAAAIDAALVALHSHSLVELDAEDANELGDMVSVHPVIQAAARSEAPVEAAGFAVDVLTAQAHGGDWRDRQNWPLLEALLPHGLVIATTARAAVPDHAEELCALLNWIGLYQEARGTPGETVATVTVALDLATNHLGPDAPLTLTSRINLAYGHHMLGDVEGAVALLEPTLADCERVLGSDHAETIRARNNLAGAYEWLGDTDRAIPLHQAALADRERILGPDHFETLQSRHNLATAYRIGGQLDRAIELYDSTFADLERVLGPEHPSTLLTRTDRASAYLAAGDVGRAVADLESVAADFERLQGPVHPGTLRCRGVLAAAYRATGDVPRAVGLYEETLAHTEQVLGADHPQTERARTGLARAREALGDE